MIFTREFLASVSNWQNGWRENQELRLVLAAELKKQCVGLPDKFKIVGMPCYRKRFLHQGELGDIVLNDEKSEGPTSWTVDVRFAERFKDLHKPGAITAAIFEHSPQISEVVVNIVALWQDQSFVAAVEQFASEEPEAAKALLNFRDTQGEVVLDAPLRGTEIVALTGVSSPFDDICDEHGIPEEVRDVAFKRLVDSGTYPGVLQYAPAGSAPGMIARVYKEMQQRLAQYGVYLPDRA